MSNKHERMKIANIEVLRQVRTVIDPAELEGLKATIREGKLIEPVVLKKKEDGGYRLVAGERRLRAMEQLGYEEIEYVLTDIADEDIAETQLVENLQRADLNDMDLADALADVMDRKGYDAKTMAEKLGKSESFVKQRIMIRKKLVPEVQLALRTGEIEFAGARALCGLKKDDQAPALEEAKKEEDERRKALKVPRGARLEQMWPEGAPGEEVAAEGEEPAAAEGAEGEEEPGPIDEAGDEETSRRSRSKKKVAKKAKKAKKEPKVRTAAVRRKVRERKRSERPGQTIAASDEMLEEKLAIWIPEFIEQETKGKGLDDTYSKTQLKNKLKSFATYLRDQRVLIIRS